jgi:transcription antitermination factor NusA-like protein
LGLMEWNRKPRAKHGYQQAWSAVAGKRIARHTRIRLVGSKLVVDVDDPVWSPQLKTFGKEFLSKLQIERVLEINALREVTKAVVEAARESLVIGKA